jgi:hypothetical protein
MLAHAGNDEPKIAIDLAGVLSVSDSFADEFFAVLIAERGEEWFRRHVAIENSSDEVRAAIVRAIRARLEGRAGDDDDLELADPPEHLEYAP